MPLAVDVDPLHGKIYWGTATEIRRSNLNGSGVETVASVAAGGYTVAVDPSGSRLYWIDNSGAPALRTSALDGSGATDLVLGISGTASVPRSIELGASSIGAKAHG